MARMTRTIVSIPEDEKAWVDGYGRRHRISSAAVVRRAIREFRRTKSEKGFAAVLRETAGTWTSSKGDSRDLVASLRKEWDDET
jgi:hypothetical protein